jgi:hypothetical protein
MSNETPAPEGVDKRHVSAPDEEVVVPEQPAAVVDDSVHHAHTEPEELVVPHEPVPASGHVNEVSARVVNAEPATEEPVLREPVEAPVLAAPIERPAQTVYVMAPVEPRKKGNRGFGVLIAVLSTIVFAVLFALILAIIEVSRTGVYTFDFLGAIEFYVPVLFFLAGFIIVALLANRANWWAYILGSIFVALLVYFGTVGTGLLAGGIVLETPRGAARLFGLALANPFVIAAALLARELALWAGAGISARGRRVTARNVEARSAFEREEAERRSEYAAAV